MGATKADVSLIPFKLNNVSHFLRAKSEPVNFTSWSNSIQILIKSTFKYFPAKNPSKICSFQTLFYEYLFSELIYLTEYIQKSEISEHTYELDQSSEISVAFFSKCHVGNKVAFNIEKVL